LYQVSEVSGECPADGETECPGSLIESRTRTHTPRLVSVR
jgi:hypothetical protein